MAQGADHNTTINNWRMWNDSWITGDQIYLLRVTLYIKAINFETDINERTLEERNRNGSV